jgi:hypothetical protein
MMNEQLDTEPITWRRLVLVLGLVSLVVATLLWFPTLARPQGSEPKWETVRENFNGPFPGAGWAVIDNSDTDGGEYTWGRETFTRTGQITYTSLITALWSVGGGADGVSLTVGISTYADNVDAWAIYGPLDLHNAFGAQLTFDWWLDTPTDLAAGAGVSTLREASTALQTGDWFGRCVLFDLDNLEDCRGAYTSGSTGRWLSDTLTLNAYVDFSRPDAREGPIWIAFHFVSDWDGRGGLGAFLDNVVLRVDYGFEVFLPLVDKDPISALPMAPTATPPEPTATYRPPPPSSSIALGRIFRWGVNGPQEPDEYVEIRNNAIKPMQLEGYTLRDGADNVYTFPYFVILPGQVCRVYTNELHPEWCGFSFGSASAIWDNDGDCATLHDSTDELADEYCY